MMLHCYNRAVAVTGLSSIYLIYGCIKHSGALVDKSSAKLMSGLAKTGGIALLAAL